MGDLIMLALHHVCVAGLDQDLLSVTHRLQQLLIVLLLGNNRKLV